ncbi:MAG: DUF3108 domain-containing protein [Flavobacteriales bacterium]
MARKTVFSLFGAGVLSLAFAQGGFPPSPVTPMSGSKENYPLRSIQHNAFKPGEKLTYVVHYGWLDAGEAVVELKKNDRDLHGREVWHAVGTGKTLGAFNTFYKVEDTYETYFDANGVFPWKFVREVSEGGYEFSQNYEYTQHLREVKTQEDKVYKVPGSVQDMLSAFYYARTINYSTAAVGDVYTIETFMDGELWPLRMQFMGKETIKLRNGKYRCLKFQPVVQEGRIFEGNDDLNVWITEDGNHIPVLAQAKVLVGSIKMELASYEGLAHPIAKE